MALISGNALLAGSRLLGEGSAPALAQLAAPETHATAAASPATMAEHDHMMVMPGTAMPGTATPATLPGMGTPVSQGGLIVIVATESTGRGPTDVTIQVSQADGEPLQDARVVVFAEMTGMSEADMGVPADEATPGHYVAKEVPLTMAGDWRLSVRISPKGQATQIVPVALSVAAVALRKKEQCERGRSDIHARLAASIRDSPGVHRGNRASDGHAALPRRHRSNAGPCGRWTPGEDPRGNV